MSYSTKIRTCYHFDNRSADYDYLSKFYKLLSKIHVPNLCRQSIFGQKALYIKRCTASASCGCNGLTIVRVSYVTGSKHTGYVCGGVGRVGDDIAGFIGGYLIVEHSCVGAVTYSEEESVYSQVKVLFTVGSFVFNKMCTFKEFLAEQACSVCVEKHFDISFVKHSLLHNL